jgi:hypothetical protein
VQAITSLLLSLLVLILGAGAEATGLNVKIEHHDTVAPVESSLQPGDIFDKKNLPSRVSDQTLNDWYEIPSWLAGKWHKEAQTDYYRYDYLNKTTDDTRYTREARSDGTWGTQQGLAGHIWQYDAVPYCQTVDGANETIYQIVRVSESLECSEERFVKRSIDTQLRVDKSSGRIKTVETGEEITIFTPESDTMLKRKTSSKVFDHMGQPIILGMSLSFETKLGPFERQDYYRGQDTRTLFLEFMKNSGILGGLDSKNHSYTLLSHLTAR